MYSIHTCFHNMLQGGEPLSIQASTTSSRTGNRYLYLLLQQAPGWGTVIYTCSTTCSRVETVIYTCFYNKLKGGEPLFTRIPVSQHAPGWGTVIYTCFTTCSRVGNSYLYLLQQHAPGWGTVIYTCFHNMLQGGEPLLYSRGDGPRKEACMYSIDVT